MPGSGTALDPPDRATSTGAPGTNATAAPPAYRVAAFRRYALGQAVSVLGDQVWYVALSWTAVQVASPGVAGLLVAASAVPRLVLMLLGGVVVDRYQPRTLMIRSDLARSAVCLGAALVALWHPGVALLLTVALIFGAADAVFLPAAGALQPRLLSPAQYASGNATVATANRAALTLGAPIGGLLISLGGLPVALLVNAATFLASVLSLWRVPAGAGRAARSRAASRFDARSPAVASRESANAGTGRAGSAAAQTRPADTARVTSGRAGSRSAGREFAAGLRYLGANPVLRTVVLVGLLVNIGFVGPMNVGLALVADAAGWGASGIGAMLAGFGVGAVAGGLLMLRSRPRVAAPVIAGCMVLQAAALVVPALTGALPVAVAATVVVGLSSGPAGVLLVALMQSRTDDAYRGRVSSVNALVSLGVSPLAIGLTGVCVDRFGLVPTYLASGALVLAGAVVCVAVPALRTARLP